MTSETPHTGEGLALDFINTRPLVGGARRDFLADSAGLAAWLALVSLDGAGDGLSADDLAALHRLRDAGEACLEAAMEGAAMPEAALAEINGAAAAAPTIVAAAEAADGTLRKVARQLGRPGAALRARIPVSVCGEVAGDPRYTALLLGLGVRDLSMVPPSIPVVKKRVRTLDLMEASRRARVIMDQSDSGRIATLLDDFNAVG